MDNLFISSYLERLQDLQDSLNKAIEGLPDEAMDWEPGSEMNSIAVLLAHTAGSLRYWIGDGALGEPSGRVRENEFKTRGVSSQEMQRRLDSVFDYARSSLPRLTLEDLEEGTPLKWHDKPVSCGWTLLHALEHGFLHLGHIQITRQLWMDKFKPA